MTDTDLERRLRDALAARAAAVTARDLRPAESPSEAARQSTVARWWLPLTAGAAAAAVSITAFALLRPNGPANPPAAPPSPAVSPTPSALPTSASPPAPTASSAGRVPSSSARPASPTALAVTGPGVTAPAGTTPTPSAASATAQPTPTGSGSLSTVASTPKR
ncbi:Cortactin-binding protein 2 [Actinoplanes sp. SE50]|uniref:hypothetical protein n=1 Tax=unclassified Actinoplanes TaxID=2626549 RepID=UPI00023EC811|nr:MULTISPECIES: hypothetical protein [unclassified Actinoplanes]AEV85365.1 Cortactin-binding protein 2 [Actinoplanes sp. SE50/110]ATO83760.1 Cortactin-binding protein 2 [Actinoplanes sp. SE50]SLM01168.1 hypothetical protein ACSP50_4401 [Actinoplanes sp. SE50/110]